MIARFFVSKFPYVWPVCAGAIALTFLGAAHGFEHFGGLQPCALCLRQREAYWLVLGVALLGGITLVLRRFSEKTLRCLNFLLSLAFIYGAGWAIFHTGVEMGIFDEPATCVVLKPFVPGEDFLSQLNKPIMPPSCADVPWRFLGLSMAAWNALCVVTLSVISLFATFIRKKSS